MDAIASLFIQNPAGILLVGGIFFGTYWLLRKSTAVARPRALLWPATGWALWAIWEFLVVIFTPEADIRVDLLLIIPLVLILSAVGLVMLFVKRKPGMTAK